MKDDPLIVIALTGEKRHGKDTASKCLHLFRDCEVLHIARPMKHMLQSGDGQYVKELTEAGLGERWGQQRLGTESRVAARDLQCWVASTAALIHYLAFIHPVPRRRFVISDMSYELEADVLRDRTIEWGGVFATARIVNPRRKSDGDAHSSENGRARMTVDETIVNGTSKQALCRKMCVFFDGVKAIRV